MADRRFSLHQRWLLGLAAEQRRVVPSRVAAQLERVGGGVGFIALSLRYASYTDTVQYALHTTHCKLHSTHYPLHTTHDIAHSTQMAVWGLLLCPCGMPRTQYAQYIQYTVRSTVRTTHYTLQTTLHALPTTHDTRHSTQYTNGVWGLLLCPCGLRVASLSLFSLSLSLLCVSLLVYFVCS